jgi:hypothetical protein
VNRFVARALYTLGALALLGGACFALLVGGAVNWLACENAGTPACRRQDLAFAQYVLAIVGLVPALALVLAAALQKRRLAAVAGETWPRRFCEELARLSEERR